MIADGTPCPVCGHPLSMSRCWRLTCRSNGGSVGVEQIKRASAARAQQIAFGHPTSWGEPPDPEFML